MCDILLSINPEHVENIFNGTKKYEYRKNICKRPVEKIVIYSTAPVQMVVGEAKIEEILSDSVDQLWEITKNDSGIDEKFFYEYFRGRTKACAYKLNDVKIYETPETLDKLGIKVAPQSYMYI